MSTTTKHYVVKWSPWSAVKAAAKLAGWDDADGQMSVYDFVDIFDFETTNIFRDFASAVTFARSVAADDTWNCPRISREVLVTHDRDDLGRRVKPMLSWDREAMWELFAEGDDPVEDKPDIVDEINAAVAA